MIETWLIIVIHQLVFQGMFVAKNIILRRKTGNRIRGNNREAITAVVYFAFFISAAMTFSLLDRPFGEIQFIKSFTAMITGLALLLMNLVISGVSLVSLKDSWRVGVIEDQKTELITSGIYRFTRNPYFASYILMFAAYTVILQNLMLLGLSVLGFFFVHTMILKEEKYLYTVHGDAYLQYKKKVPRYLIV